MRTEADKSTEEQRITPNNEEAPATDKSTPERKESTNYPIEPRYRRRGRHTQICFVVIALRRTRHFDKPMTLEALSEPDAKKGDRP